MSMRTNSAFLAGAASATILAVGFQMGQAAIQATQISSTATAAETASNTATAAPVPSEGTSSSASTATTPPTTPTAAPTPTETTSSSVKDGNYTGDTVQTRYGPSQVQVTIANSLITEVTTLQRQQNDPKSERISSQAAPMLRQAVLSAQSAKVSNISGATYTSQSYLQSLQSALDQANFQG